MSGIPAGAGQLLGKRLGKYEILALLALGGTAEIYLARIGGAAGFEKYMVVKCLHDHLADDAEFVKMFLDEARLAAHLDHSNIVQTMELGQHEGRYYMVMEFLAGLSLAMVVRRAAERLPSGRVPVPLVLNILAQSCAGLHYAHEKAMNGKPLNIVHRDISPQNLVISFEGVVKLVDFGIAKAELRETRTRSGTIKGKFAYMSPEQCVANNVDRRTDVFALGVIAHELLTGQRLFKRASPYETYQAVIECNVKPPSAIDASIDPALDPVILRAVAKDKADRYPTAEAFGDALLGYLHHRGIGSGPGDVSRFFDASFAQEIEEHSARMRELISGRDVAVETSVTWGADDPEDEARREAAADRAGKQPAGAGDGPRAQGPGESDPLGRPSAGSLSMLIDDLGGGAREGDGDELPADRTRIESNPLEKLGELDRVAATAAVTPAAPKPSAPAAPKPSATPAPRPGASRPPPSGALPLPPAPKPGPAASASPSGMPPSGRFPELANLPTMIAQPDADAEPQGPGASSENLGFLDLPTEIAPGGVPPAAPGFANAPPFLAAPSVPPAAGGFSDAPTALVSPPLPALARTQIAPAPMGLPSYASNGMPPRGAPVPPMQPPGAPQGYPVMNAQMSAQIATGATVFPSDHRGSQPPPAGHAPPGIPASGPSFVPSGPSPGGQPRVPDSGPGPMFPHHGNPVDPVRGPAQGVPGPPHPEHGHRDARAASLLRSAPPWMLAVLFVGALGVALLLTIVIARVLR